jgi:hypothetical protein
MTPVSDADILRAVGVLVAVTLAGIWRLLG